MASSERIETVKVRILCIRTDGEFHVLTRTIFISIYKYTKKARNSTKKKNFSFNIPVNNILEFFFFFDHYLRTLRLVHFFPFLIL